MNDFRAILFAGGAGRRLWPLSRVHTPKQFAPLIGDRSSFELAVDRLAGMVPAKHIYVGTNAAFADQLHALVPAIPRENYTLEPVRRDVAAGVALAFFTLEHRGQRGPTLFQWSDNYVEHESALRRAIAGARELVTKDGDRIVFIGEKPRFANENLGWIEMGEKLGQTTDGLPYHGFRSWHYRPAKARCEEFLASGNFIWNSGFFVSSVEFMTAAFRQHAPQLTQIIERIVAASGQAHAQATLDELYPTVPKLHFDSAILEKLDPQSAYLLPSELGWSDPGSLYSLKEALQSAPEATVTQGECLDFESRDCLLINRDPKRPLVTVGLDGLIIVQAGDVTLAVHKDRVRDLSSVLESLEARGYENIV